MKKLFIILVLLLLTVPIMGQTKYDAPRNAVRDTLSSIGQTRAVRDFWFNPANDSNGVPLNYGIADILIQHDMWSTVQTTDTLTAEVYGLTRIKNSAVQGWAGGTGSNIYASDSTRLGTIPVSTTIGLQKYALDLTMTTMYQYDGLRLVLKLGGADADSVKTWSQLRGYIPSVVK